MVLGVGPIRVQHLGLCSSQPGLACRAPRQMRMLWSAGRIYKAQAEATTGGRPK
jgi:hypothetical protein